MARSRNIKPSFFTNDVLAECSMAARIMFAGLWVLADREGRLEDRPKKIKAEVLPYDDFSADDLLNELAEKKFITRYAVGENKYIQVLNFKKHQNPHQNEQASVIPEVQSTTKEESPSIQIPDNSGLNLIPDSLIPHTDSPIPQTDISEDLDFEEFWDAYPRQRRGNKQKALKAFLRATERGLRREIVQGCHRYAASEEVAVGRAKGCEAWLNDDRWTFDYTPPKTATKKDYMQEQMEAAARAVR